MNEDLLPSKWLTVTQLMIDLFSQATLDPDPMHIDPAWCEENSPFGCTIVFGFQTIGLLAQMLEDILLNGQVNHKQWVEFGLNYGFDKLRLVAPV